MVKELQVSGILGENKGIDYSLTPGTVPFILQKVLMLVGTPRGSLPLQRDYGYDPKMIDKPFDIAYAAIRVDLQIQLKKWISEVSLKDIKLDKVDDGKYYIKLLLEVNI